MARTIRVTTDSQKTIVDIFNRLACKYGRWSVWSDFVTMAACSLSFIDETHKTERQKQYANAAKQYTGEELERFSEMFAAVVNALEEDPNQDFLGDLFMRLELHNEWKGQFFTPYSICAMMSRITAQDFADKAVKDGYISVNDPACGAGALLVAFANEVRSMGINYQECVEFVAQDIDFTAAMMCYIQLSLLGCAGYVIVGDTLRTPPTEPLQNQNVWYTPMYFRDTWHWKRALKKIRALTGPIEKPEQEANLAKKLPDPPVNVDKHGQLTLF